MKFDTDNQTLSDLNLTGKFKKASVFSVFDNVRTAEGERLLEKLFSEPLTSAADMNRRSAAFRSFSENGLVFPFDAEETDKANSHAGTFAAASILSMKVKEIFSGKKEYSSALEGFTALLGVLLKLDAFLKSAPAGLEFTDGARKRFSPLLSAEIIGSARGISGRSPDAIGMTEFLSGEKELRKHRELISELFDFIWKLDVLISVGNTARERCFCYAEATEGENEFIDIRAVRHPSLKNPVPNDFRVDSEHNLFFLTGVNMAGKSTFMKAVSIAVYLAHAGFPVPADSMTFTPLDGMFTSVNLSDNLSLGYSHFYAEVMRVKNIALKVSAGERLFIVFDELFKGTNVKDAYEATLAVTEAFAAHRHCLFMISTHITEVGQALAEKAEKAVFRCLNSSLENGRPVYTYTLEDGISAERRGMDIIRAEHILEAIAGKEDAE